MLMQIIIPLKYSLAEEIQGQYVIELEVEALSKDLDK